MLTLLPFRYSAFTVRVTLVVVSFRLSLAVSV